MFWLFALPLLTSWVQAGETPAGLEVQVAQKGLDYGKQFGLQLLNSRLKKDHIQDFNGSHNFPLIGNVQYAVSGIHVHQFQANNTALGFAEGSGVKLTLQDAQIFLKCNWSLETGLGYDEGTADIILKHVSLSTVLGIDRDDNGRPLLQCLTCQSSIGDLDLKFYGGASWLYNFFATILKGFLRSEVNKQLCVELRKGVRDLAHILTAMKVSAKIDSFAEFNYSLVNKPVIGVDKGNATFKGEFFRVGQPSTQSFAPDPFLLPDWPEAMIQLGISEQVANSAAFVYFTAGALQINYTDGMIPPKFPFRLNTKNMGLFIPELKKRYPNMAMEIHVTARKQPVLRFHPGHVNATVFGSAEAFVVLPNASLTSICVLNIDSNLTGQFFLLPSSKPGNSFGKASGSVALKNFRVSKEKSNIGEIKMGLLGTTLELVGKLALASVNKHLKKGITLPNLYNVSLVNPKVTTNQAYMVIATDLHHSPQAVV